MYSSVETSGLPDQNVLGLIDPAGEPVRTASVGMQLLHQRAMRAPDFVRSGPRIKPQDLVRLILGHRALARRVTAPKTRIALQVFSPGGSPAVLISFE